MERLHQITVIDGVTVQEAQAGDMIHNIPELIEYASSLITVFPGDVMQSGTSGGTGAGRVQRATGSGFLQDGETIQASIEGIGTLTHVVAQKPVSRQICQALNCHRSAPIATTDKACQTIKIPPHPVSAGFFCSKTAGRLKEPHLNSVSTVPSTRGLCVTGRHAELAGLKTVNWYRSGLAKAAARVRKHVDQREIRKKSDKQGLREAGPTWQEGPR